MYTHNAHDGLYNFLQLGKLRPGEVLEAKVRFVFAITQSLPARIALPARSFSICFSLLRLRFFFALTTFIHLFFFVNLFFSTAHT